MLEVSASANTSAANKCIDKKDGTDVIAEVGPRLEQNVKDAAAT